MKKSSIVLALASCLALAACSKSESKGGEKGKEPSAKPAEGKKAEAAAPTSVTLAKVDNLKMDVPAGAEVGDQIAGSGNMVQGPDLVVSVEVPSEMRAKTVEDAQKEADMYSPKNLKTEKLADGWALTFENSGSMGANYFVQVRREIGGKSYWCETTASNPTQAANALAACKSLKK